jgi:exopolyphosphatase/pppGpp-phosphohydrolase
MTEQETYMLMKAFMPEISNEEIKQILSYTHYQPYLIKIFVSKLKQNGKLKPVSEKLAMETYNAHALEGILPNYFAGLSDDDQKIVLQIHRNQFKFDKKYEAKLLELTKYGYLKFESGAYQISNWFFKHWLGMEYGT